MLLVFTFNTKKDKMKITYQVLSDIYSIIDEELISLKNVIAPYLTLCGWNVSHFLGKSSTFLRSKSGKINNKKSQSSYMILFLS